MKNKKLRVVITEICVSVALILSVFTYMIINGSTAWFAENDEVSGNNMNVSVKNLDKIPVTVKVYGVETRTDKQLTFNTGTDLIENNKVLELGQYSIVEANKIYYLIHIHFESAQSVTLTAQTEADYFMDAAHPLLGSADGTGGVDEAGKSYNNSMSSIIAFAPVTLGPGNTVSLENLSEQTFGNANADGVMEMTSSLTLANGEFTDIYILVSFHDDNLTKIYSDNIGNSAFQVAVSGIKFYCDFGFNITKNTNGGT